MPDNRLVCPNCEHSDHLIIYAKVPIALYPESLSTRGGPIITEKTDICCLYCYWQGELNDLDPLKGKCSIAIAKKRVIAVLRG
jgi:hypothetical protein